MIIGFKNIQAYPQKLRDALRELYLNPVGFYMTEDEEHFERYDPFTLKRDLYVRDDLTVYIDDRMCGESIKQLFDYLLRRHSLDWYIIENHVYPQVYLDRCAREWAERKREEEERLASLPPQGPDNVYSIEDYFPPEHFDDGHFEEEMREIFGEDWEPDR